MKTRLIKKKNLEKIIKNLKEFLYLSSKTLQKLYFLEFSPNYFPR